MISVYRPVVKEIGARDRPGEGRAAREGVSRGLPWFGRASNRTDSVQNRIEMVQERSDMCTAIGVTHCRSIWVGFVSAFFVVMGTFLSVKDDCSLISPSILGLDLGD